MNTKTIPTLRLDPVCSLEDSKEFAGRYAHEKDYSILINDDCDAYNENGEPLFFFRRNRLPADVCRSAYTNLRKAPSNTDNRGMAAGPLDTEEHVHHKRLGTHRYRSVQADGTLGRVMRAKQVMSGIAGFFDRSARFPFCRQTSFTEHNRAQFRASIPYFRVISQLFQEACPERYEAQLAYASRTNKDFLISGTVFTTVTVNRNFQTAYHVDAGDLKAGLGNLSVLRAGTYQGGYTVIPRYDCAFDLGSGDVCFFDVHEYHGNTPITAKAPYERISIVCYYREKMSNCGSMMEELERAKRRRLGDSLSGQSHDEEGGD